MSDQALLEEARGAAIRERSATTRLIALLMEVDARRLYLGEGYSSLFTYCTRELRLSEHAAYGRIQAARTARRFPRVLELFESGDVTLTTVCLLAPHLTPGNHQALLNSSRHHSKRDVEGIVANLRPQPAAPTLIRKLPQKNVRRDAPNPRLVAAETTLDLTPVAVAPAVQPTSPVATMSPLAPELYKLQVTLRCSTHEKLRRVQALLRHTLPDGDVAAIIDRALTVLLSDLERTKAGRTEQPRSSREVCRRSRHIPAGMKRLVWIRDQGLCAFVGTQGRCEERAFLEFHHRQPYAAGGLTVVENLELRCRAHNLYEAERYFGDRLPLLARESAGAVGRVLK